MFDKSFLENVFSEFRYVVVDLSGDSLSKDSLVRAVTMNENIRKSYGLTFKPVDIAKIAKADKAVEVYETIKSLVPKVKAKPMYPDFPSQVIGIDEAVFRLHQMLHYFSTYGIEELFDVKVTKGWLPKVDDTKKIKPDRKLLSNTVIEVIDASEAYLEIYRKIVTKRERMTVPETELVRICVENLSSDDIRDIPVTFKENLFIIFSHLLNTLEGTKRIETLKGICANSGDVFKCVENYLRSNEYNLSTSQKRALVKLFESYSIADFKGNLMLSNKKREKTLTVLRYLDYNKYSNSEEHKEAVRKLRNSELKSWEGRVKAALAISGEEGLRVVSERPGMLLRYVSMLMKSGVDAEKIKEALCENASKLSTQTLVKLCTFFSNGGCDFYTAPKYNIWNSFDTDKLEDVFVAALKGKLENIETPIKGKKVFIDETQYSFEHSVIEANDKSDEGGYIRSGLTMKVPFDSKVIRLFTYWNDKRRVDIDLHGYGLKEDGSNVHIGWNGGFAYDRDEGGAAMVHSGDITHSNAAEYIDIDLKRAEKAGIKKVLLTLRDFTHYGFDNIETVLVGVVAVSKLGVQKDVKLYNPANCFFSHNLKTSKIDIVYGVLDLENKEITFVGKENTYREDITKFVPTFGVGSYLKLLTEAQGCEVVENREDADFVLRLDKGTAENEISLIDENYWMDR